MKMKMKMKMSKMPDREKVINGLEETREFIAATKNMFKIGFPNIASDVYDNSLATISDAITLLKAQEPRVMTLSELVRNGVVWLEDIDKESTVPGIYCDGNVVNRVFATAAKGYLFVRNDKYDKCWRCWTSRPTDEQMEATPWE